MMENSSGENVRPNNILRCFLWELEVTTRGVCRTDYGSCFSNHPQRNKTRNKSGAKRQRDGKINPERVVLGQAQRAHLEDFAAWLTSEVPPSLKKGLGPVFCAT